MQTNQGWSEASRRNIEGIAMNSDLDAEQTSSGNAWQPWGQVLENQLQIYGRGEPSEIEEDRTLLATRVLELELIWPLLKAGLIKVSRTLFTSTHTSFLLAPGAAARAKKSLPERYAEILERTLLDSGPKVVAAELGYSISGIGTILRQSLEFFGLACKPSQVPALLVMAAAAARVSKRKDGCEWASSSAFASVSFVTAERPERVLRGVLSPAQLSVTALLVEGKSYSEIASLRHTSERTIANQVAGTFRRLGVSGRAELLRYLVTSPRVFPETPPALCSLG
ncbi:MAG TPA: helix-turn-helix transcriptional regulator [Polyangiaceae bacterium]|nr:helix-turn-helix transcriptional regulator [Polyangiaceae bacterium]